MHLEFIAFSLTLSWHFLLGFSVSVTGLFVLGGSLEAMDTGYDRMWLQRMVIHTRSLDECRNTGEELGAISLYTHV